MDKQKIIKYAKPCVYMLVFVFLLIGVDRLLPVDNPDFDNNKWLAIENVKIGGGEFKVVHYMHCWRYEGGDYEIEILDDYIKKKDHLYCPSCVMRFTENKRGEQTPYTYDVLLNCISEMNSSTSTENTYIDMWLDNRCYVMNDGKIVRTITGKEYDDYCNHKRLDKIIGK